MKLSEALRAAFVIARRDFTATVMSKAFLFFLLGPLFPIAMGLLFGSVGERIARDADKPVVVVIGSESDFRRLSSARARLAPIAGEAPLVTLDHAMPEADVAAQRRRLLHQEKPPVLGVLEGGLDHPTFTGPVASDGRTARQLDILIEDARRANADQIGHASVVAVTRTAATASTTATARSMTARAGQALLFLLTLLLAGMLLSQLIEEKSNKVIEILAAAVPIDAIFLGKLVAMLAMSLVGITAWLGAGALALSFLSASGLSALPAPAVGWALFLLLCFLYFAMSYLLIGAAFLGIGAQASTVREVQTLSMPVTMSQVLLFALASTAVGAPDSREGLIAAIFPLSSPFAMLARAAEEPALWPHFLALGWQALWVILIVRAAAAFFRRSVLKSGGGKRRWWRRPLGRNQAVSSSGVS